MRISGFNVVLISQWTDAAENEAQLAWCRDTYTALQPYLAPTRYVNYLATDESGDAARRAGSCVPARCMDCSQAHDRALAHLISSGRPGGTPWTSST